MFGGDVVAARDSRQDALSTIAEHERRLLAQLAEADRQAEQIRAEARDEAARIRDDGERTLSEDLAELREEARHARLEERTAALTSADREAAQARAAMMAHAPEILRDLTALVVPALKDTPSR